MKNDNIVEEIKAKIDIVDIVSEHVDLKRAGQNYKGLCPFHAEKTPSFMVSPSKQIFHCFGCHKGGDVFAFVMGYENLEFQDAVSFLADKAGLKVEDYRGGKRTDRGGKERLLAMYGEAAAFFRSGLGGSKQAEAYLRDRGLNSETVAKFGLGYSRNAKIDLLNYLESKGFLPEQIKKSGLVYFGENGAYDFFRDRLMFPIFDLQGRVIAFGGRILSASKNAPKYINSPDSAVFNKSESVYGLNFAKNAIAQKGYSIITEGYLDAIMCHQHGLENAVAPLGTALTSGHLKKLGKFSNKVVLVFDGDQAGISATKRSLELAYAEGITAKVLLLPRGEDPDTFLRKEGLEQFRKYLGRSLTPVEFFLKVYGRNKLDAARHLLHALSSCPDRLMRDEALRELSEKSGISELALRGEFKNAGRKGRVGDRSGKAADGPGQVGNREEWILLNIALSLPEKTREILDIIDLSDLEAPAVKGIFEKLRAVMDRENDGRMPTDKLLELCDGEERGLVTRLSMDLEIDTGQVDENIESCLKKIAVNRLEKKIRQAEQAGNDAKLLEQLRLERSNLIIHRTFGAERRLQ